MAFASTTEWDVRTTGSDNNGGGFDTASTGTDYSQQDSPQVTYTDLVIDATTNTKCTSAGNPFTSAHVGNIINITSGTGFTVQRVQVVSVAAAVATCDKSLGTLGSTGGNGKLGGALATIAKASPLLVLSNTIHVKAGTYTVSSGSSQNSNTVGMEYNLPSGSGTVWTIGYNATHRDGGTKPLITTATSNLWLFGIDGGGFNYIFENLSLSSTATTRVGGFFVPSLSTPTLTLIDCILDGFKWGVNGDNGASRQVFSSVVLSGTEIKNSQTNGIINSGTIMLLDGSWVHDTTGGDGVTTNGGANTVWCVNSIVSANSSKGITASTIYLLHSNIANNTGDGIGSTGALGALISNSIIYGNGGYGVNAASGGNANYSRNNAFGSNASGNLHNFPYSALKDVALTANPFMASGSGNFALNATAGGGPLCKLAGFPGVFPGGTSTGYLDIGAVQTTGGGGGSAAMLITPGMSGGIRG